MDYIPSIDDFSIGEGTAQCELDNSWLQSNTHIKENFPTIILGEECSLQENIEFITIELDNF
jgi:hypothetical protein